MRPVSEAIIYQRW